jgi:hypothetical protein
LPSSEMSYPVSSARIVPSAHSTGLDSAPRGTKADRIIVRNPGPLPELLYSLGIPRSDLGGLRPTSVAGTFESVWTRAFPPAVELHRMEADIAARRDDYETKFVSALLPDRVHVEIAPESDLAGIPNRTIEGWKWTEKRSNSLRIALPPGHPGGWLVLSEPFSPGWRCTADGNEAKIYAADAMFRAVPVAAGAREVERRYFPPGLAGGLIIFVLTLGAILGLLGVTGAIPRTFRIGRGRIRRI